MTITFGRPVAEWISGPVDPDGGALNVAVPVLRDGEPAGTAYVGWWITTQAGVGYSAAVYDEVRRHGFSLVSYEGDERRLDSEIVDELDDVDAVLDAAEAWAAERIDPLCFFHAHLRSLIDDATEDMDPHELLRVLRTARA